MEQLRNLKDLNGYTLAARDGEIGTLNEVYFDDQAWVVRYLVVYMGGLFPGREVLITPQSIEAVDWPGRSITVDLDHDAVKSAPEYDPSNVITAEYEARLSAHYGKSLPARRQHEQEGTSHA